MEFNLSIKLGKKQYDKEKSAVSSVPLFSPLPVDFISSYIANEDKQYNSRSLQWMFDNVSQISSIVRYIAEKMAELPIKHVRVAQDGTEKDLGYTDVLKLLNAPNQFDNGKNFKENLAISLLVHGNIAVNKLKAVGFQNPTSLYILPATDTYAIPQHSDGHFGIPTPTVDFRLNPITHYNFMVAGVPRRIEIEDMVYIKLSNINYANGGWMYGQSKLYSATRSIDTLSLIYDVVNAVLSGPLGFVKRNIRQTEVDAYSSFGETDKQSAEERLSEVYGTRKGKRSKFVTRADLSYMSMVEDLKKFLPVEMKESEFESLCNIFYALPVQLFNSKASTYDNMTLADKAFYTKCLMPISCTIFEGLSSGLGLMKSGELLRLDFSKVECLQGDKKLLAEVQQAQVTTIIDLMNNGFEDAGNKLMTDAGLPTNKRTDGNGND